MKNKTLMSIWVHISWYLILRKARKPTLPFKTGYWPIPCFSETGYWPIPCFSETGYWPIPCFERFLLFFALLQCYWLDDGSEVLENSLLIPRWKKIWIPHHYLSVVGSKVDTILGPHHWVVIIWFPFFKKRRKYIQNKKKIHIKKKIFPHLRRFLK